MRLHQRLLGALPGIGDTGQPGLGLARLPLHGGQRLAGLGEAGLAVAPHLAQLALLVLRLAMRLGCGLGLGPRGFGGLALRLLLLHQQPQPAPLAQAARRRQRPLRRGDETVPAPQVALKGDKPLPRPQQRLETRTVGRSHHAHLLQAPRQLGRGHDVVAQRLDRLGQGRVGLAAGVQRPAGRRPRWRDRHIEVVAQRRRQRQLVARGDLHLVQHRRHAALVRRLQELGQRLHLGLDLPGRQARLGRGVA